MEKRTEVKGVGVFMTDIERIYTINLRKEWLKEPRAKRAKRAIKTVRDFVGRHTKAKEVKISKGINEMIFAHGFKKPPGKIKVKVKGDVSAVEVRLIDEPEEKKMEKKSVSIREKISGKKPEEPEKEQPTKAKINKEVEKRNKHENSKA